MNLWNGRGRPAGREGPGFFLPKVLLFHAWCYTLLRFQSLCVCVGPRVVFAFAVTVGCVALLREVRFASALAMLWGEVGQDSIKVG